MTPREIADGLTINQRAALESAARSGVAFLFGGEECEALMGRKLLAVVKDRHPSWSVVRMTDLGREVAAELGVG